MKRCIVYLFIISIVIGIHSSLFCQNAPIVVKYSFEPAVQHFNIPPGVSIVTISISGSHGAGALGGNGASFTGICNVISPHVLSVVVGQRGDTAVNLPRGGSGGGGGASWVYDSNVVLYGPSGVNGLLAVAAGGGGQSWSWPLGPPLVDTTIAGSAGGVDLATNATTSGLVNGTNATDGAGGNGCPEILLSAGGGGGWLGNGDWDMTGGRDEANHFSNSMYGGGGFGGGGGSGLGNNANNIDLGGGGGGYNGGGGGGGGGSYLNGTLVGVATASDTGNGSVTISYYPSLSQVIAIYPNPTSGLFIVNGIRQGQILEIYNCLGQKLQTLQADNTLLQVDLSKCSGGVYFYRVITSDGSVVATGKFVIAR